MYADVNAIIIGYYGRIKMLAVMQGVDPNADQKPQPLRKVNGRIVVPSPDELPPLTEAAFDAMFPGRPPQGKAKLKRKGN